MSISTTLDELDWTQILEDRSVEESWQQIKKTLNSLMEGFIPKGKAEEKVKALWMFSEVVRAIEKKTQVKEV